MAADFFQRHKNTLDQAVAATRSRAYFSVYPEVPSGKIYGETAKQDGENAFKARLNRSFKLDLPSAGGTVGAEASPYGFPLGIQYPRPDLDALISAAKRAMRSWAAAAIEDRVGVCLEILHRINKRSFEMAFAVMHTTGQGFMMAFQAGGPHAQDRGLEAVAYAYEEMTRTPSRVVWEKQVSKTDVVKLEKVFRVVPRGLAVVVGCSTFPTWNGYPGLFASLATGNAAIVKPHPGAILPLATTVEIAREVLKEAGFDPNTVVLAADTMAAPMTQELLSRPEIKIIDYTGGPAFGRWIEDKIRHAAVFSEKAGVNSIILDSVEDLRAVTGNLAFSLSLYSGQMCTTPQNIFIPRNGIKAGGQTVSFDEAAGAIVKAVDGLLGVPERATEILGAIQNPATEARVDETAKAGGNVLRPSARLENPAFPEARVRSPLIIKVDAGRKDLYMHEVFGPIAYIVATENTEQSIELAAEAAEKKGAITGGLYSTSPEVIVRATDRLLEAGVALSINLTGPIYVNQSAAFSDYHVSAINPAGNATLCDAAFVTPRFNVAYSRKPVTV